MKKFFEKLKKYPLIIYFAIVLYVISIADLFSPIEKRSELENRELQSFPKFSWSDLFHNKYTPKIEDFTEDHFIFRDKWISLKSMSESVLGKQENNNVIYGKDGYLFTKFTVSNYKQFEKNINSINKFIERHNDKNIKVLFAPTAPGILTDKIPMKGAPVIDTEYILNYAKENLKNSENTLLDVKPVLSEHSDEYIYYRTDHHWTTLGAYYAYEEYMSKINKEYTPLESYESVEVENFLGTHFSKSKNFNVKPDTLMYIKSDAKINIDGKENDIYEYEKLDTRDKYAMFMRGNPGQASIKGNGEGKVMVIKDSYANCFMPFMINDFEQIDIFDLRYISLGLDKIIEENNYDQILILYNCETLLSDKDIAKLNMFN